MKKLFGALLIMLIGVMLIPVVQNSIETYDIIGTSETFVATQDVATAEVVTVTETPTSISSVTVNGTALILTTEYTVVAKVFTLAVDASIADDVVVVNYDYETDMGSGIDGLVNVIMIMFVIGVVAGGVAYIKFKM